MCKSVFFSLMPLAFLFGGFSHATEADWCGSENIEITLKEEQLACEAKLQIPETQANPDLMAATQHRLSEIFYNQRNYSAALDMLFRLKSTQPQYLEDPLHNYDWFYLMGRVKLRSHDEKNAIMNFQEALRIAKEMGHQQYIAFSLNALGLSYDHIKDYPKSLSHYQESLTHKKVFGTPEEIGITLNNIANVYDYLEDHENALAYYLDALEHYQAQKSPSKSLQINIAHCLENMGVVYQKMGNHQASIKHLKMALEEIENHQLGSNTVNILTYLASAYLDDEQIDQASHFYQTALEEDIRTNTDNAFLRYQLAKFSFLQANEPAALVHIRSGIKLAQKNGVPTNTLLKLYALQAEVLEHQGQFSEAILSLKEHSAIREALLEKKFDQNINNKLHQIENAQQRHELTLLEKEAQLNAVKINRQYWVIFSWLLVSLTAGFYLWRVFKNKSAEKARLINEIETHRNKLHKLEGSKEQLKQLYQDTSDPVLCIDSGWSIAFHNDRFKDLFNNTSIKDGEKLNQVLPELFTAVTDLPTDMNDMPVTGQLENFPIQLGNKTLSVNIQVNTINLLDDFAVFSIADNSNQQANTEVNDLLTRENVLNGLIHYLQAYTDLAVEKIETIKDELRNNLLMSQSNDASQNKRLALVDLMSECIQVWSNHTKTSHIELAEACGYWRVSIDDGRLRTRALDRYLDIRFLPQNPRWRQVVKTAHYILSECELDNQLRSELNLRLETFLSLNKMEPSTGPR